MFLRAVYSLGDSPNSCAVEFRTTSQSGDNSGHLPDDPGSTDPPGDTSENCSPPRDDSENRDARGDCVENSEFDESRGLGSSEDCTTTHSALVEMENCLTSEVTGQNGTGMFPPCLENDIRPVISRPSVTAENQSTSVRDEMMKDDESFDSSAAAAVACDVEVSRSNATDDHTTLTELDSQDEDALKCLLKPPDESWVPRRNSSTQCGLLGPQANTGTDWKVRKDTGTTYQCYFS